MSLELGITLLAGVIAVGLTAWYMSGRTSGLKKRVIGNDVFVDIWVNKAQVEGEETLVFPDPEAPDKEVKVKLPSDMGKRFALRLQGRGKNGEGDLYINVKVRSPNARV